FVHPSWLLGFRFDRLPPRESPTMNPGEPLAADVCVWRTVAFVVHSLLQADEGVPSFSEPERSTGNAFIHRRQHLSLFYPFSLYDPVNCIGRGVLKCLGLSVRPSDFCRFHFGGRAKDRKSTRLNSSHQIISYAVFCLKKK